MAALAAALLGLAPTALADAAPLCDPAPCFQPDLRLRIGNQPQSVGDDVVDIDAVGQTRVALVRREGAVDFYVRVENQGTEVDDLQLTGSRNTEQFFVSYFFGSDEISAAVREGVYRFEDVPVDGRRTVRIHVKARRSAPVRSFVEVLFDVTSVGDPSARDVVKGVVFRSQGVEAPIEGRAWAGRAQAQRWARQHGATEQFVRNALLYWDVGPARGIRPEVAYAQSAKETAYGRFGGVIDASFRNPCGLKTTAGGGNGDPSAHQRFATWRQGVTACIDHLGLYAGAAGYPRSQTPDPRHFPSVYATAPTVERLGGRWAPDPDYGNSIVRDYLNPLLGT